MPKVTAQTMKMVILSTFAPPSALSSACDSLPEDASPTTPKRFIPMARRTAVRHRVVPTSADTTRASACSPTTFRLETTSSLAPMRRPMVNTTTVATQVSAGEAQSAFFPKRRTSAPAM